jgi:hypothetical protein
VLCRVSGAPAARLCLVVSLSFVLSGCGLHLYRQEQAQLAQSAKTTFTEKIDLLSLVATERANLAKQREAELAAIRENQIYQRDLVFFNAAQLPEEQRFLLLRMPRDKSGCAPGEHLKQRYLARRACDLGAETPEKLNTLANAAGDVYRSKVRQEYIAENRAALQDLGWTEAPKCDAIPAEGRPNDIAKKMMDSLKVELSDRGNAADALEELIRHCKALAGFEKNLAASKGLESELRLLKSLQRQQTEVADEGKRVAAALKELAGKLKTLAESDVKEGETRASIAKPAQKLREHIDKAVDIFKSLGAQDALADLRLDAATTLLQALEGEPISNDKLRGDDGNDLRRAVIAAQTVPQLADEMRMIHGLLHAPSKSSLLIAQRQALIDKENVAAKKANLEKRVALVQRRISQIVEEARLLQLASAQANKKDCIALIKQDRLDKKLPPEEFEIAEQECDRGVKSRLLLGFNYLSRSMLSARADQEATRWEEVYLQYEQNIAANEYALKSWNNLVGTPIVLLEGYHTGGIKVESLGDLIFKAGGLGLFGILVNKAN